MNHYRYWGLFWVAIGMAAHSLIVGRVLGSSFFMLVFFWGWVAAAAFRGKLESAFSLAIVRIAILLGAAAILALTPAGAANELAYYTFALYPALVSWACVLFYVRHLQQKTRRGYAAADRRDRQSRAA